MSGASTITVCATDTIPTKNNPADDPSESSSSFPPPSVKPRMKLIRTLDATLSAHSNETAAHMWSRLGPWLPQPCRILPPSVGSLRDCARTEIALIEASSSEEETDETDRALDDGFVLCDLNVIRRKLEAWRVLFPQVKPFYALKCNPDAMVATVLAFFNQETGFDCASPSEIRLALEAMAACHNGANASARIKRCIYANPQRSPGDLAAAVDLLRRHSSSANEEDMGVGIALTYDGTEEVRKVSSFVASHKEYQFRPEMMVRLTVPDKGSTVPLGEKFGCAPSAVPELIRSSLQQNLPVVGVSFHCGSGCHDPDSYGTAIRLATEALEEVERQVCESESVCESKSVSYRGNEGEYDDDKAGRRILDIGGGYPGADGLTDSSERFSGVMSTRPLCLGQDGPYVDTAAAIADVVTPMVDDLYRRWPDLRVVAEPGRYFVEEAYAFCLRVYSVRIDLNDDKRHYYIAQGVHGVFKDVLLCGECFLPIALSSSSDNKYSSTTLYESVVHGPSGEDYDVVCQGVQLPALEEGDWLLFDKMGAYTLSIAARSGALPVRYVIGGTHS